MNVETHVRPSGSVVWVELAMAGKLNAKLSLENGGSSEGEPALTRWLAAGDEPIEVEPGMFRDNAGMLRHG